MNVFNSLINSLINSLAFFQLPNTQQGAYNRIFSIFTALIIGPPLAIQVELRFTALRDVFVHREKDSMTYHWLAFVLAAIFVELPYMFVTSLIYWLIWYYAVGYFYSSARAGYSVLMWELFAVFATSIAQLCVALFPDLNTAFTANGFFFMFCNTLGGILSPEPVTPASWKWYYNISPLFYLSEGMTTNVLHDLSIQCEASEASVFTPPDGMSCGEYAASSLQSATGYLLDPNSTTECEYCRYRDGQAYVS